MYAWSVCCGGGHNLSMKVKEQFCGRFHLTWLLGNETQVVRLVRKNRQLLSRVAHPTSTFSEGPF